MATDSKAQLSPLKAAKRARYRADVLAAAEALFAEHGVDGTRIEQIAAAAGIAPRTLYTVFDSKRALVRAISEEHRLGVVAAGSRAAQGADTALQALLAAVRASTGYYLAHPDHLRHELREARFWADERASESSAWAIAFDAYSSLFTRAMADGDALPGDPTAWARALLALQQSQLAHWVIEGMPRSEQEVIDDLDHLVRHAFATSPHA